jgi:hypothetical protein
VENTLDNTFTKLLKSTLPTKVAKCEGLEAGYVTVASIDGYEHEVFKLAVKEGLTIHDAAYLYYATRNKSILVTDDIKRESKAVRRDHNSKRTRVETIYYNFIVLFEDFANHLPGLFNLSASITSAIISS